MEKVSEPFLIVTTYPNGIRSKTIELQREVYDKFNVNHYPKLGFGTGMPAVEFQNYLWVMNGFMPKNVPAPIAEQIKQNSKDVVNAEIIFSVNSNILPLNEKAIDFVYCKAKEGNIVTFSLYDGIAFSKETYTKLGSPNMSDLFSEARKNKVPIITLTLGGVGRDGCKTYSYNDKEMFWQSSNENSEQKYWDKCEEVLVRGMYEDRSIKH